MLSASFDGLTMDEAICFEHKTLNDKLRNIQTSDDLPAQYVAQIEQQLMVSGAKKCLFMASKWDGDELVEEVHIWVESNPAMRTNIKQGWAQFAKDLEEYKHKLAAGEIEPPKVEVIAVPVMDLPALSIQVNGSISLISNLQKFGARLNEFVAAINKEPSDDQGFADAEQAIKTLQNAQDALEAAETNALAQTADIDEMRKTVKLYGDTARTTRLMLEKMVKARKESIRLEIISKANAAYIAHIAALEAEIKPLRLVVPNIDAAAAIKGKRTIASLKDAVDTVLANSKIAADSVAKDVRAKLAWCKESSAGYGFLFNDLERLITKPMDDFQLVITSRISQHKADEVAKEEATRARIQAEEEAKAQAKAKAEQDAIIAAERAKVQQEERAAAAELAKAQREEDARVAKLCAAETKPVHSDLLEPRTPSRGQIILAVSEAFSISPSLAETILIDAFAKVAA